MVVSVSRFNNFDSDFRVAILKMAAILDQGLIWLVATDQIFCYILKNQHAKFGAFIQQINVLYITGP